MLVTSKSIGRAPLRLSLRDEGRHQVYLFNSKLLNINPTRLSEMISILDHFLTSKFNFFGWKVVITLSGPPSPPRFLSKKKKELGLRNLRVLPPCSHSLKALYMEVPRIPENCYFPSVVSTTSKTMHSKILWHVFFTLIELEETHRIKANGWSEECLPSSIPHYPPLHNEYDETHGFGNAL